MSDPESYFAGDTEAQSGRTGTWVRWDALDPLEMVPGLTFQPVLGDALMVNFVSFEPHTEAPLHWHDEEQITYVMDGEFEFTVAGETRTMRAWRRGGDPAERPARRTDARQLVRRDRRVPPAATRGARGDGPRARPVAVPRRVKRFPPGHEHG